MYGNKPTSLVTENDQQAKNDKQIEASYGDFTCQNRKRHPLYKKLCAVEHNKAYLRGNTRLFGSYQPSPYVNEWKEEMESKRGFPISN